MADATGEAVRLRDLARRARRLAQYFTDDDRSRLLAHADDLDRQAAALEQVNQHWCRLEAGAAPLQALAPWRIRWHSGLERLRNRARRRVRSAA